MTRESILGFMDAVAGATSGTLISNLPKIRLLLVRRSINGLRMVGIEPFERICWSVVVSLVESIGPSRVDGEP